MNNLDYLSIKLKYPKVAAQVLFLEKSGVL